MFKLSTQLRVLLIEDNPDDSELILVQLEQEGYELIAQRVESKTALIQALGSQCWDVILADYSLPQFSALEALAIMQQQQLDIPFIIVSGAIGEETAVAAMKAGAHDYVLKGNLARLIPAVEREIREARIRQEHHQALTRIQYLAFHDELTGLANKTQFLEALRQRLNRKFNQEQLFAVLVIDIDRYNNVKYGLGHGKAIQLLKEMAQRLKQFIKFPDQIARVEEDQFAILLDSVQDESEIQEIVNQLHQGISNPFQLDQFLVYSSISIGIVDSTIEYSQPEDFFRAADTAHHYAQKKGVGQTLFFSKFMQIEELERLQLETDLKQAISQEHLKLFYQPLIELETKKLMGFEALIRWNHPQRGWIYPSQFIPLAEQTGLIIPVGEWVLKEARRQMKKWQQELKPVVPLSIAVNLSGMQLIHPQLLETIEQLYCRSEVPNFHLKIEVTETMLMENADLATRLLHQLKTRNIAICIDDFGTGYSSLSYLRNLPIDILKVDRSFVHQMTENPKNYDIIKAIIALGQTLGLEVIAEGIETQTQLNLLRSLSCKYGQGYLFSKPLPADEIPNWIREYEHQQKLNFSQREIDSFHFANPSIFYPSNYQLGLYSS